MNNESFKELLKNKLDEIKEKTLEQLLLQDDEYQHASKQQGLAEAAYLHLNLTDEQKSIIDNLLYWTDASSMEYSSLSYLAGLFDGQKLYETLSKDTNVPPKTQLIRDFYRGNSIPVETPFESPATTAIWSEINNLEEDFNSNLSAQQSIIFQQLLEKRLKGITGSIEDSFLLGFQLGAKFMIDVLC